MSQDVLANVDILEELDRYSQGEGTSTVNPQSVYRELRESSPIFEGDVQIERLGLKSTPASLHDGPQYTVLGFEECAEVLRNSRAYSGRLLLYQQGKNMGETILTMDDPKHRLHRLLVQNAFTRKAMEGWRVKFAEPLVEALIDGLVADGTCQFVDQFARPLPVAMIQEIIGLPAGQLAELHELAAGLMLGLVAPELAAACGVRVAELLEGHLAERRRQPTDDVMSILVNEELSSGEKLTDEEIISFLRLLLPAGAETTSRLMSSMMARVLTEAGLAEQLREDPELIPKAITETLRLHPPFQYLYRLVTEPQIIDGVEVPEGAAVSVCLSAANRDPTKFKDPDEFRLDRTANNLGFGSGMHMCLGVHLARMEAEVTFRTWLRRFPDLRLDPDAPAPRAEGTRLESPRAVHVKWD